MKAKEPTISPVFEKLLPPLHEDEYRILQQKIIGERMTEKLIVWKETGILVDGHHRLKICKANKISYKIEEMSFGSEDQAKVWVVCKQMGRRNIPDHLISYYRGKKYLTLKEGGNALPGMEGGGQAAHPKNQGKTAEIMAEEAGVDERTIRRDAEYAAAVDASPDKDAILSGEKTEPKAKTINAAKKCERCSRMANPPKKCSVCDGLKGGRPRHIKLEKVVGLDWDAFAKEYARIGHFLDAIVRAYPEEQGSKDYQAVKRIMSELDVNFTEWRKRMAAAHPATGGK